MVNIEVKKLWRASAVLTFTSGLMLAALVASVAGIFVDDRVITGAPAWMKPAKFAISTAIFTATMAWLFRYLTAWPRLVRGMGWVFSVVLVLEVGIIDIQAARGVRSHFNVSTTFDSILYQIMGVAIGVLLVASIAVMVLLFRQKFADRGWGWALRLGMLVTVLGSAAGGLMLRPTPDQMEALRGGGRVTTVGAHTVGAPDGGPGLPGVGWSVERGDLRIPHFLGLHGIQMIPLAYWLMGRRRVWALAGSYLGLIGILSWQALRGQSVIRPDGAMLAALGIWLAATFFSVACRFPAGSFVDTWQSARRNL